MSFSPTGFSDYFSYGNRDSPECWLSKSDLKPGVLKRFGIKASSAEIENVRDSCVVGYVITGNCYHQKRVRCYSVGLLSKKLGGSFYENRP